MSDASGDPRAGERQQGIAAAITEISERATLLVREEIELAKTEVTEKATKLAKGAVVAIVAGVFFLTALFFVLIGLAWLLYYELPIGNEFTYFWGFFAMALILVILGAIAGLLAAKAVKSGSPPVPAMAIEEARKIRETVSAGSEASVRTAQPSARPPIPAPASSAQPAASPVQPATSSATSAPASATQPAGSPSAQAPASASPSDASPATPTSAQHDSQLGRETGNGPTLGR